MKKTLILLLAAVTALSCFAQGTAAKKKKPVVTFKTILTGNQKIFKPGDTITFKMEYTCPADYRIAGWGGTAYLKNVPADFAKALNLKVYGKNPQWQNVRFMNYTWYSRGKEKDTGTISTKNWPEGDYDLSITALFREKAKGNLKTDVYRGGSLMFTLEK